MSEVTDTMTAFYVASGIGAAIVLGVVVALAYGLWTWLRDRRHAVKGAPK
jgi:ABC-type nitrate/sulfonate/bicarbonate transport system permease component